MIIFRRTTDSNERLYICGRNDEKTANKISRLFEFAEYIALDERSRWPVSPGLLVQSQRDFAPGSSRKYKRALSSVPTGLRFGSTRKYKRALSSVPTGLRFGSTRKYKGALSSVGLERYLDTVEVRGSNPLNSSDFNTYLFSLH